MTLRRADLTARDAVMALVWLVVLAAFVALAIWCDGRYYLPWDVSPELRIQDLHGHAFVGTYFGVINNLGGLPSVGAIVVTGCALLWWRGLRLEATLLLGAIPMRAIQLGVRQLVDRPFSPEHPPKPDFYPGSDSFPSGHVLGETIVFALLFVFATSLIPIRPLAYVVRALCIAAVLSVGPARIYIGAHWPSDVIGGFLLAALYLIPALWLDRRVTAAESSVHPSAESTSAERDTAQV